MKLFSPLTLACCLALALQAAPLPAWAAMQGTVKATASDDGCKATDVTLVRQSTGDSPENLYKVSCQSDDGKPHDLLVSCLLEDCRILGPAPANQPAGGAPK